MASDGPAPQSLKSWQDVFQYPIPTVRRVEQELRRDIESNKEKLRALVGTRYRELVGTAETIVVMNREIQEVDTTLADIGRRCNPRLVEKKHTDVNQIKGDVNEQDKRALGGQLSLLHRCTLLIARLLKKRGSLLLVAKLLVVSRLLQKTLSQQETTIPFLESLRTQLGSLRRTLQKRTDKRLASAKSTVDEIIEALATYCLATSSSSDDAIRHFHKVRLEVIGNQLKLTDTPGENVLNALRLYIQTLQTSKTLLSRRLSDALGKLKAQPILADPEVRNLDDLSIDVLGGWVAADVKNFTPWIKLSELSRSEAEKTIKQWSKQAFESFVKGCHQSLTNWSDFSDLLCLRRKTLELWLSSWASTPIHSSLGVLEGIRTIFNERLTQILSVQAKELEQFGKDISSTISNWNKKKPVSSESLWDYELMSLDYSHGAVTFKQTIMDRLLGLDEDISTALKKYQTWLQTINDYSEFVNELRQVRWSDMLEEGEDEDSEVDITAMLNEADPRLLSEALQLAVRQAFEALQSSFTDTFKAFGASDQSKQAAFLLKLIRLVRRDLPTEFISQEFALSMGIVPQLQEILAKDVVIHARISSISINLDSRSKKLPGRTLWGGDPELPIQPSPSTFKFLRRLVEFMDQYGPGLWDLSTVQVLKGTLQKELSSSVTSAIEALESSTTSDKSTASDASDNSQPSEETTTNTNGNDHHMEQSENINSTEEQNLHDHKIQLFFDIVYLKDALEVKDLAHDQLADVVEKLRSDLDSDTRTAKTMEQRAHEYWKRTELLFGPLAVGSE